MAAFVATWALAAGALAWPRDAFPYASSPMCAFEAPTSVAVPNAIDPASLPLPLERESTFCPPPPGAPDRNVTGTEARRAHDRVVELTDAGRPEEALLHLEVVQEAYPTVADRLSLKQGELWLLAGNPKQACRAFERARNSLDRQVAARARVGLVRCLIASGSKRADDELRALLRTYPDLPMALELRYELARAEERAGNRRTAARMYRNIDARAPGSGVARRAQARLAALERDGVELWPLPASERVERLERLARSSPPSQVKEALAELQEASLGGALRSRVALVAARIARVEGRWKDAHRHLERARWTGSLPEDTDVSSVTSKALDMLDASTAQDRARATKRIRRLKGRRPYRRLPVARLLKILEEAAPAEITEVADDVLDALEAKDAAASHRFDAAMVAAGAASDEVLESFLDALVDDPRVGLEARYHRARALERLDRWAEAERELVRTRELDGSNLGYYRMWAELRLRQVREAMVGHCGPDLPADQELAACSVPEEEDTTVARPAADETTPEEAGPEPPPLDPVPSDALAAKLEPIAERFGDPYPWLPRAVALLRLGDRTGATDELHEAYMAWREARGRPIRRAGLVSVFRGDKLPRRRLTWKLRRERRGLDPEARQVLAEVAGGLGDAGLSVGFGGWELADTRPRPHAELVRTAADRHGIDPNLLFAVMRVESVYQPRIISYAGAVGLMQIMPVTGKRIARQLERTDFNTADLLDPAVNIEFAAWYLSSLIERFDGRLPLAIASYNGGPHNVRRWIRDHAEDIPLDAFLERIPFSQTHRYVRRVLTHYAAYRDQQNLPMTQLPTELPTLGPDPIGF